MLRIDKVIKSWKESAALNDHINLYGHWSETAFLTKSGDLGMVLRVVGRRLRESGPRKPGICGKRLEAALKLFRSGIPCLPVPVQVQPPRDSVCRAMTTRLCRPK